MPEHWAHGQRESERVRVHVLGALARVGAAIAQLGDESARGRETKMQQQQNKQILKSGGLGMGVGR